MDQKTRHITRSVGVLSALTALSRVLGYVRDAINAALFGAGWISDAFFVAYRIPNMLRDLLAEGALSSAFIPSFVDYFEKKGKEEAFRLASIVLTLLAVIFSGVVLLGWAFAGPIVSFMAPGFLHPAQALTVKLTRILFPFIAFMGLAAVFMGMLNSMKKFTMSALAPAVGNLVMIGTGGLIMALGRQDGNYDNWIVLWSAGAVISGLVQLSVQVPEALKQGFRFKPSFKWREPGILQMAKLMAPAVLSNSVGQVQVLVNTIMASTLGAAAVTYLYYGYRLMQLPMGIFGVSIATAVFPLIAAHAAKNESAELKQTLSMGIRLNMLIALPATAGLIVLSYPINALLFMHGKFGPLATHEAARAASWYTAGLLFVSLTKLLTPTFFALKDSRTPVIISVSSIIINILLSLMLMRHNGFIGLAAANTFASVINFTLLFIMLRRKLGALEEKIILVSFLKIGLAALIMGFACWGISAYFGEPRRLWMRLVQVLVSILAGVGVFGAAAHILGVAEIRVYIEAAMRRFPGKGAPAVPAEK